jgi:hypothetical protein
MIPTPSPFYETAKVKNSFYTQAVCNRIKTSECHPSKYAYKGNEQRNNNVPGTGSSYLHADLMKTSSTPN